ncbi:serine/threonine protein kinase [Pseudoneurospora amorphoporcata]|uniref:Serine/threonine protein kinase n=1 Tax=Pseudoneurospora amorphoporcata TaxID=241081 RepID=A0AAN6SJP5_9PEZI|nr:serine/threonine protein kinase [Pseudoneurospora amorphoporcata]
MDSSGLDPFLNKHFRYWKLGHASVVPVAPGICCHTNKKGEPIQTWGRVECLGSGSFGNVWKEEILNVPTLNRVRVVKQLHKEQSNFIQVSRRELYAMTTFSWETAPKAYVKHGDLQRYIELGVKFPDREAPLIMSQIARALKCMHFQGFVHRDLKPSNILVAAEGPAWSVKIADFGAAANVNDFRPSKESKDYIRTSGYTAPELVDSSQAYTTAVDIWALGAVGFCLLVGVSPFYKLDDMLEYCAGIGPFPTCVLGASSGFSIDFILRAMIQFRTKDCRYNRH